MKKLMATIICLFIGQIAISESSYDWKEGVIVLHDLEVLTGQLFYNYNHELVLHKDGNQIKAYPASKIKSFLFFDEEIKKLRKFISLENYSQSKKHVIYEYVKKGTVSVVKRTNNNHFFLVKNQLIEIKDFNEIVFPDFLKNQKEEINSFIESEKLNLKKKSDQVMLVSFFNTLPEPVLFGNNRINYLF